MRLGSGKLYVTIERRPCFFRCKNSQSAIFTARRKISYCVVSRILHVSLDAIGLNLD